MAEKLRFRCLSCQRKLKVPPQAAGKHVRCPDCGATQLAPVPPASPEDQADQVLVGLPAQPPPAQPPEAGETLDRPAPAEFAGRDISAEGEFRYQAFLSYRHVEPDRTWGRWQAEGRVTSHR